MAALDMGGFWRFFRAPKASSQIRARKRAHQIAMDLHKRTKGPTPDLVRIMKAHRDNQASAKTVVDGGSAAR